MKLCITEKPTVAADIANILGATHRHNGYYEGDGVRVTWTYGHLCSLFDPADYTDRWKRWCLSELPMLPDKFHIKVIDDGTGKKQQFEIIRKLIAEADVIINCGDAGQEGELIQRWVMKHAGVNIPVERLWISSLTNESIREGLAHLKPQKEYDNLFYAGMSRAIGDWVLGMNATRLYTLKYSQRRGQILSIGRVQTPTLALIVKRQKEIDEFVPSDSWELHTIYRDVNFTSTIDRFGTEEEGLKFVESLKTAPFVITDIEKKKGREAPPRLFDLTSLQVECNKRFGWTAENTLKYIQSLYEKKLTTYPRVDTTYLSDDLHPKIAPTLRKMESYAQWTAPILARPIPKSKKIFDNSKVTDHHAIIPTGQNPRGLEGDEKKLYHLIAMRFIGAFYPDCIFEGTTVMGQVNATPFKATGKVILEPGWKDLYPKKSEAADSSADKSGEENSQQLPQFTTGESGPHNPSLQKKTSQPPKPYNEGTLLRAMETAGRTVEDETLREALKANGIGRPSTRAAIIETLFKRKYIIREKKNLVATQAGIDLIDTINEELLKSAKLTGIWENKLRRIESGDYSPVRFLQEINQLVSEIVLSVLNDNGGRRIEIKEEKQPQHTKKEKTGTKPRAPRITRLEQVMCPKCGQGHLLRGKAAFGCSRYAQGCDFRLSFDECPPETKPGIINKKINK